jgi:hypothetical protein
MLEGALKKKEHLALTMLDIQGLWRDYLVSDFGIIEGHPHGRGSGQGSVYNSYVHLGETDLVKRRGHVVLIESSCYMAWFMIKGVFTHRIGE